MKKIVISTIMRDAENVLNTYYQQLKLLVETCRDIKFYLSIYENDSQDKTKHLLNYLDWSFYRLGLFW